MRFTSSTLLSSSLAGSSLAAVVPRWNHALSCSDLWEAAPKILPDLEVYIAEDVPAGYTLPANSTWSTPAYPAAVPDLPAFCRFGAYIHTSNMSNVQFEVWLPDEWSGRFSMVGNGGDSGGVNFPDMWAPIKKYNMAVASTDTGHNGTSGDGTFAISNPESQIDFGYRAVHLTTVYSKKILAAYYGRQQDYSYWLGCSSGGKQGLKEVQEYPEDYDGVIAGAAAQYWPNLMAEIYWINTFVNAPNSSGHLYPADYSTIGKLVLEQCDGLDGVMDGFLTNPRLCKPDLSSLLCGASNASSAAATAASSVSATASASPSASNRTSCLSEAQVDTMYKIWGNYTATTDIGVPKGSFTFSGYAPGAEGSPVFSVNGEPYSLAPDYFQYQVLNLTDPNVTFAGNETELERLLKIALDTDPGRIYAANPNISTFLNRGKLLTYVGEADTLIPTFSTHEYYEDVRTALGHPEDLDDSYRFFTVPGLGHCRDGPGPGSFGGPGQRQDVLGGAAQAAVFDKKHDMLLAMIDWVENGNAPDSIIAAKYKSNNKTEGIAFTRPLCPYPQFSKYMGGDSNDASNFECVYDW